MSTPLPKIHPTLAALLASPEMSATMRGEQREVNIIVEHQPLPETAMAAAAVGTTTTKTFTKLLPGSAMIATP
ncbi:hypothetical protein FBQ82_21630, partial [Anaerolineae bacterium CFX7]|nr:hypothetical protein [Anaerolineae bacterium CFX7]